MEIKLQSLQDLSQVKECVCTAVDYEVAKVSGTKKKK
jgi:hypothetical protein